MKTFIFDFGRRSDGTIGFFQVYDGVSSHNVNAANMGVGTDPPTIHEIIFRGNKLKIVGRITTVCEMECFVFMPETTVTAPILLEWCNNNRDIVYDLFEKHGLDFITPEVGLEFVNHEKYEKYIILINDILIECKFTNEETKKLVDGCY